MAYNDYHIWYRHEHHEGEEHMVISKEVGTLFSYYLPHPLPKIRMKGKKKTLNQCTS